MVKSMHRNLQNQMQTIISATYQNTINYSKDNYWVPNKPPTITAKLCTIKNIYKVDTNNNIKQLPSMMGKLFKHLQVKSP